MIILFHTIIKILPNCPCVRKISNERFRGNGLKFWYIWYKSEQRLGEEECFRLVLSVHWRLHERICRAFAYTKWKVETDRHSIIEYGVSGANEPYEY